MHLTPDQWIQLCNLAIFPACWWLIKYAIRKIKTEFNETVDQRAIFAAAKRAAELKVELQEQFRKHEVNDERRFQELADLITPLTKLVK